VRPVFCRFNLLRAGAYIYISRSGDFGADNDRDTDQTCNPLRACAPWVMREEGRKRVRGEREGGPPAVVTCCSPYLHIVLPEPLTMYTPLLSCGFSPSVYIVCVWRGQLIGCFLFCIYTCSLLIPLDLAVFWGRSWRLLDFWISS
jgi:hypothetical protein